MDSSHANVAAATTIHVRKAMDGDSGSLDWIVGRLNPVLRAHADYRLGANLRRQIDAQELVNEAWVALLPKIAQLGERGGRFTPVLLKYLTTTITYQIAKLLRRRGAPASPTDGAADAMSGIPAKSTGVLTRAAKSERDDHVHEALEELREADREIILLRGIEQLSSRSVAESLEITPQAVDQRYSRALKRLREQLPESVFVELDDFE